MKPAPTCVLWCLLSVTSLAPAQATGNLTQAVEFGVQARLLLEVDTRLRAKDLTAVAWGAYLAGRYRLEPTVPALRAKLSELVSLPREPRAFAALAIIDALVQTRAIVPQAELEWFAESLRVPVWILLARDLEAHRQFFLSHYQTLDDDKHWIDWLAAGNLLAGVKDLDFTKDLLKALRLEIAIVVRDPGDDEYAEGDSSWTCCACICGSIDVPEAYPPIALYSLTTVRRPGDMLFAKGPPAVFVQRVERGERIVGCGDYDSYSEGDHQSMRLAWLAQMLATSPESLPLDLAPSHVVDWHGPDAYLTTLRELRVAATLQFERLVDRCVTAELIPRESAADLTPHIEFRVHDARKQASPPLAALPSEPSSVPRSK
ncbi:MAG: hypothetical protein ABIP94_18510 [Planctomycetota bacterium]